MEEKQDTAQGQAHAHHTEAHPGCFFCNVAIPQMEAFFDHCWPEGTRDHFRNARVEMLKGFRSMLDARIERLSRYPPKGTKVTVE
jgi:hypothetical protein